MEKDPKKIAQSLKHPQKKVTVKKARHTVRQCQCLILYKPCGQGTGI
jgi:hypothetical protein